SASAAGLVVPAPRSWFQVGWPRAKARSGHSSARHRWRSAWRAGAAVLHDAARRRAVAEETRYHVVLRNIHSAPAAAKPARRTTYIDPIRNFSRCGGVNRLHRRADHQATPSAAPSNDSSARPPAACPALPVAEGTTGRETQNGTWGIAPA